jgi:hypothetical protein
MASFGTTPSPKDTPAGKVRKLRARAIKVWQPYRDAMEQERDFLAGDRFDDDHGNYVRDRRMAQVRGQETYDAIRHIVAKVTERPRSLEARPVDHDSDPAIAEIVTSLIERELADPVKKFDDLFESAIEACRASRLGVVWADWEPDQGPFGEILFREIDGKRIMWDPAFEEDPHHPACGWLIEEKRLDVEIARDRYGADWLQPDRDAFDTSNAYKPGIPLIRGSGDLFPPSQVALDDDKVTLWLCWYKNDQTMKAADKTQQELDPEKRYMMCLNGCGFRSQPQGVLRKTGGLDNPATPETETELPAYLPQGCPVCGGDMQRVDGVEQDAYRLAYEKGKRLVITAPMCVAPDDRAVYDDKWPIPRCRSFPGFFITANTKSGKLMGPSDVTNLWDLQIAADNLRTLALQRIYEHRSYWVTPAVGMNDTKGKRFRWKENQENIIIKDMTQARFGALTIEQLNGTGLDPMFPIVYNVILQSLVSYRGIADLGLTPENTKNIAASTVAQLSNMGEVPLEHFRRRKNRQMSKFAGVVSDMILATLTPERAARLRIDGIDQVMNIAGDDMPNYDFVIEDSPQFSGLEKEKSEAFSALMNAYMQAMQMGFDPMGAIELFAQVNGLPPSIVRAFEKMLQGSQMQQQMMQQMRGAPGGPGNGTSTLGTAQMGAAAGAPINGLPQ